MAQTTLEQKKSYLDVLAVFHYVIGGLWAVTGVLAIGFMGVGLGAATSWGSDWEPEPGCALLTLMVFLVIVFGAYTVLNLIAGRALQTRNHYVLCLVTAGLNCLVVPLGTLLGIFSLVLLTDTSVRPLFEGTGRPMVPAAPEPQQPGAGQEQPPVE